MWYMLFIVLLVAAVLFMILGIHFIEKENVMLSTTFILLTIVLWFLLAAAVVEIEFPYTVIQNDNTVVTGTHTWGDSTAVSLMYFFMLMGCIEVVYSIGAVPRLVFKIFKQKHLDKYGKRSRFYIRR